MTRSPGNFTYPLLGAALMIGLPLAWLGAQAAGLVQDPDATVVQRLFGVSVGLILAAYGNVAPRRLVRYDPEASGRSRKQAMIRFAGRVFVLAGLGHSLAWLVAPIETAAFWSMAPVAGGLLLVLARCFSAPPRAS